MVAALQLHEPGTVESTLRAAVAERIGEARFGLWFGEGVRLGVDDDALQVGVPNAFFREWIQAHFAGNLIEAAEAVTGRALRLAFRVVDEAEPSVGHVIDPPPADERRRPGRRDDPRRLRGTDAGPGPASSPSERPRLQARPPRRLDDFVTGSCNRLAHAAAMEMVQSAGEAFNPLVIHGADRAGQDPPARRDRPRPAGPASRPARHPRDGRGVHQRLPRRDAIGEPGRLPLQVPRGRRADRRRRPLPGRQAGDAGRVPAHLQRPDRRRCGDRPGGRPASQADRQADRRAGDPVPGRDGREARGARPPDAPGDPQGQGRRTRRRRARGRDPLRRRAPPRQRPRARRGAAQPGGARRC